VLQDLTSFFGSLALLAIIAAGFLMMWVPALGRQLLKNTVIAIGLFVLGTMLLSAFCSMQHY
jgi:hypothetical protein